MYSLLHSIISKLYTVQVPATGIGLFRILFGLVTLQEICFLLYFNHLIFDPIPYMDVEFPLIGFFLYLWAVIALSVIVGYRSQYVIIANYIFWIVFVNFTPMQRDFDGGFDLFMIGANLFMIFMPLDKAFSIDNLRRKLQTPFTHYSNYSKQDVSILVYYIPVVICLGFLYFDSAIHKMFAEHWRNGLGAWLPASMPYYISTINMGWLLNQEMIQKIIGYIILIFQFSFIFLCHLRQLRPLYFIVGFGLHFGITVTLNIYPFGVGMLIFYVLVIPFAWYRKIAEWCVAKQPMLTVFYDAKCPLCSRTILIINHFDILNCIDFKSMQLYAKQTIALAGISDAELLKDLYAVDQENNLYQGVDTYAQILIKMRYLAFVGYLLKTKFIYSWACQVYRDIADTRDRIECDEECAVITQKLPQFSLYDQLFVTDSVKKSKKITHKMSKVLFILFLFQLNSTLHYGLIYRLDLDIKTNVITQFVANLSNMVILFSNSFVGITPHALYLHDHFEGYNHVLAITYTDKHNKGNEQWLPLVNEEGRLVAPNWGRVHSMWANIAVTPNIDNQRLSKFIMKTTAFWGIKLGLDLNSTQFHIKLKKISAPFHWVADLRASNLSGDWKTIGDATWQGSIVTINIPDDINLL